MRPVAQTGPSINVPCIPFPDASYAVGLPVLSSNGQ
jgi:hypothetical protein